MLKTFTAALMAAACVGCATTGSETNQPIKLETKTAKGDALAGAECKLSNDHGIVAAKSGDTALVRRSSADLNIRCTHPDQPEASARAISRASAGRTGSAVLGVSLDALYTYPSWMQLIFGKALVFDRGWEKEGQPTPGAEAPAK